MKGVFLDAGSVDVGDVDFSALLDRLDLVRFEQTPAGEVATVAAGARVVITNKVPLDASTLAALPDLDLICVAATGVDHVDLEAARQHGVTVCNARAYATASVAEHTLSLILALSGRLLQRVARVRRGDWSDQPQFALLEPVAEELHGRRLGLIGHGVLGQAVAERARGFGMDVLLAERRGEAPRAGRLPFESVLERADILSLHCPLTPETRGLIDAEALARMPDHALLINTARGGLVVAEDLIEALAHGTIAGAAIDVLDEEPPPPDHPLLQARFDQLIVTAHCAWATRSSRQRLIDQLAELVAAFQSGSPLHRVA